MIKVGKDIGGVHLSGGVFELLSDFAAVVKAMRNALTKRYNREVADRVIANLGALAYLDAMPGDEEYEKLTDEIVDAIIKSEKQGRREE